MAIYLISLKPKACSLETHRWLYKDAFFAGYAIFIIIKYSYYKMNKRREALSNGIHAFNSNNVGSLLLKYKQVSVTLLNYLEYQCIKIYVKHRGAFKVP